MFDTLNELNKKLVYYKVEDHIDHYKLGIDYVNNWGLLKILK